jgi:tryptophanyl-tRNA synthetase
MKKGRVLSGMRPSGKLHIGHLYGALINWVKLQEEYECFYFSADWHALTTEYANTSQLTENTIEMMKDWICVGLDPEKSTLFLQSMVPEHAELHLLLSMIVPLPWLERNPSYKEQLREQKTRDLHTYGFLGYPVLQAADILMYKADYVPVGEDQVAHIEISREIARRFNYFYKPVFPEPQALLTPYPKIPGIDGRKMSKTFNNAIYLSDSPDEIRSKISEMFTDPRRKTRKDPGEPEECALFQLDKIYTDEERRKEIASACRKAEIGCVEHKKELAERIVSALEPIREKRKTLSREDIVEILRTGSKRAKEIAEKTMEEVRTAIGLKI